MTAKRIVTTAPIDDTAIDILSKSAKFETAPDVSEETLLSLLEGTVGIVVRGEGAAGANVIHAAKELKVIGRCGVGYNNVDIVAATERGIPVVYVPGAGAKAVAEGAIAILLSLVKRLSFFDNAVKTGDWGQRYEVKAWDMEGKTLGVAGLGRIGRNFAKLASSFDMKIIAADPAVTPQQAAEIGVELVSLEELFAQSDYISIHMPLMDATRGIINRNLLKKVKPGAFLINTSRGGVIESLDVLLEALEDGRLERVGLDVFEPEPPDISHPIFKHPHFQCSPHAIGMSYGGMERIFRSMANDMVAVLEGRKPEPGNVVNPEVL